MNTSLSHTQKWFTLLELIVVMTILAIISLATYLPYAHHQKKVILQQWVKEVVQSLTEARNLAINGVDTGAWNLNFGLYFEANTSEILYYAIEFEQDFNINALPSEPYKIKKLPLWVQVNDITGSDEETLISFKAISGELDILSSNATYTIQNNIIALDVSYGWSTSPVLQKGIEYYTQSYISDY